MDRAEQMADTFLTNDGLYQGDGIDNDSKPQNVQLRKELAALFRQYAREQAGPVIAALSRWADEAKWTDWSAIPGLPPTFAAVPLREKAAILLDKLVPR